jgi:NADPH-dependent 2,4-dienoyl-CoA reductase/sulfur reductase-like enzyme
LRTTDFYKDANVKFLTDTIVTGVDLKTKTVKDNKGNTHNYTQLILATGGTPRRLPLDGFKTLKNIFVLRSATDVQAIMSVLGSEKKGKKVVIVGSSFIGMEIAGALGKDNEVSVIGMEKAPLERVLGEEVGNIIKKKVESTGVKFYMDASVSHALPSKSDDTIVGSVELKDGTSLPADLVILGVGVAPETSYLADTGLELEKDKSLRVDSNLALADYPGEVFAIGDIATYPYLGPGGSENTTVRIEHWNVAQDHGRVVAKIITDPDTKPKVMIPVFWSALGAQLRYCGHTPDGFDDIYIEGKPDEASFAAYYGNKDTVVAVASMNKDPYVSMAATLMYDGTMPSLSQLREGLDLLEYGSKQGFEASA